MQDITNGRCGWCGTDELYMKYHDEEWGKTVTDDKTLFEFLVLESAQAGLSWITILKKREGKTDPGTGTCSACSQEWFRRRNQRTGIHFKRTGRTDPG